MNIKKLYYYVSIDEQLDLIYKGLLDTYDPPTVESIHWENWVTHITPHDMPAVYTAKWESLWDQ